jgi:hypothetical protein
VLPIASIANEFWNTEQARTHNVQAALAQETPSEQFTCYCCSIQADISLKRFATTTKSAKALPERGVTAMNTTGTDLLGHGKPLGAKRADGRGAEVSLPP